MDLAEKNIFELKNRAPKGALKRYNEYLFSLGRHYVTKYWLAKCRWKELNFPNTIHVI